MSDPYAMVKPSTKGAQMKICPNCKSPMANVDWYCGKEICKKIILAQK